MLYRWGFSYGITFVKKVSSKEVVGASGVVTEDPELARVSGQLSRANRPPITDKKNF
ncbi:MAG: hypothetical protein F6K63_18250 [Moorea sp. SIO1G6]|uniref:hypothetical protein n=1 Tax=Moorena sp. SIO1G6 TaxID=2607840 RepID=UPI0013C01E62|nr:hypothetical protein [Moorena sp. SIO1G6]NET66220.1 hypothetical protein [Moorena sp. SIO1G6]